MTIYHYLERKTYNSHNLLRQNGSTINRLFQGPLLILSLYISNVLLVHSKINGKIQYQINLSERKAKNLPKMASAKMVLEIKMVIISTQRSTYTFMQTKSVLILTDTPIQLARPNKTLFVNKREFQIQIHQNLKENNLL